MNTMIRIRLAQSKRRIERRLDKNDNIGCQRPMITATNICYEIADRTRAIAASGIGAIHLVEKKLSLADAIDCQLHLLKVHLPYHESDHVLNIAYNLLDSRAGGNPETPGRCSRLRHALVYKFPNASQRSLSE